MKDILIQLSILFISGLILWPWEILQPLRKIKYSTIVFQGFRDALITTLFTFIVVYSFLQLSNLVVFASIIKVVNWIEIVSIPLWLRLTIAIFLRELNVYIFHWLMHNTKILWQTHKWHHSSDQMWWIYAQKASLMSQLLMKMTFLWFPLLAIPPKVMLFMAIVFLFHAIFTHANVKWYSWMKVLEWFIYTPRLHLIHHFNNPQLGGKNLGGLFTLFDRIFGTYVDPDTVDYNQEQFGLDGESVTVKMIVGI